MNSLTKTSNRILSLILLNFSLMSSNGNMAISYRGIYINFGIIWNTFSPLIIVYAISYIFSIGLRGTGGLFDIEYFVFIFLFWINLSTLVQTLLAREININFFKFKAYGNILFISIAHILTSLLQALARFLFTILLIYSLGIEIKLMTLVIGFFFICGFAVSFSYILKFLFVDSQIFINFTNFFIQALFFASNIIFPITIMPEPLKSYLLFNPIVHINEFLRESYLGIYGGFVDLNYVGFFLLFLFVGCILVTLMRLELIYKVK